LICVIIGEGVFADDKKDKENANNHQEFDFVNNDAQENQKDKNQKCENENDENDENDEKYKKYENIYEEILKIVKKYNASYDKFNTHVNFYSKKIISSKLKYNGSLPIPIPIPFHPIPSHSIPFHPIPYKKL
jgi:hypothetical protein